MKKTVAVVLGVLVLVFAIAGATYLWFFNDTAITGSGKAAYLDLFVCRTEIIQFDKVLPGEPIDLGSNIVYYHGNRDAMVQLKIVGEVALKDGAESHKDWIALSDAIKTTDYFKGADGKTRMTEKRTNEVMASWDTGLFDKFGLKLHPSSYDANTYYLYMPADLSDTFNLVKFIGVKIAGELGGMYKGSPSRQFEQQCVFDSAGLKLSVVQITPEAIEDILGANALKDVEDMVAGNIFTPGEEWAYTA